MAVSSINVLPTLRCTCMYDVCNVFVGLNYFIPQTTKCASEAAAGRMDPVTGNTADCNHDTLCCKLSLISCCSDTSYTAERGGV